MEENNIMKEKVILAYSGGLDTTAIIPWLKEHFDYEVICCCIDCGQGEELDGLEERAKLSGASKLYICLLYTSFLFFCPLPGVSVFLSFSVCSSVFYSVCCSSFFPL